MLFQQTTAFSWNTYKQANSACYELHVEQTVQLLRPLHLNKYFIAPRRAVHAAVCSAYMHSLTKPWSPTAEQCMVDFSLSNLGRDEKVEDSLF